MAQAIDINDREGLRNVIREINLDDYKTSKGMSTLIEEDRNKGTSYREGMVTEDELIEVLRYLRAPSGRGSKTRLEYMAEHNRDRSVYNPNMGNGFGNPVRDALMEDRKKEEMEYAREMGGRNMFVEERANKPSLEDIKARYMREMDALTKKFQDEINNLG